MRKIKILTSLLILSLLFLLTFVCAFAETGKDYVVDNADLLTDWEEEALSEKLEALSLSLSQDIVVVTEDDLGGKSPIAYADDFFDYNGYGIGDDYSGILMLVSINGIDRRFITSTCGKTIKIFNSRDITSLEDAFVDAFYENDNYYEAFNAAADKCEYIIINDGRLSPGWIFVSLLVGAAVAGFVLWRMISVHKNVKPQKAADTYMLRNTFRLYRSRDVYLYSHVSRIPKPSGNSSSGGSRRGSSGRSHGGGSRRF